MMPLISSMIVLLHLASVVAYLALEGQLKRIEAKLDQLLATPEKGEPFSLQLKLTPKEKNNDEKTI